RRFLKRSSGPTRTRRACGGGFLNLPPRSMPILWRDPRRAICRRSEGDKRKETRRYLLERRGFVDDFVQQLFQLLQLLGADIGMKALIELHGMFVQLLMHFQPDVGNENDDLSLVTRVQRAVDKTARAYFVQHLRTCRMVQQNK